MKTFTRNPSRLYLGLFLKILITTLWLLCIASAAWAAPVLGQNPVAATVCSGTNAVFTVTSVTGSGTTTMKWQVSVNGGSTYTDVSNGATYSGADNASLTVLNVSTALNGNLYRLVATDGTGTTTSTGALLTVNASPVIPSSPHGNTVCEGNITGFAIANDATLTYQWQVSANNGNTWSNVDPGAGYVGSTTNDIDYPAATLAMDGFLYRFTVVRTSTGCSFTSIAVDTLHVKAKPAFPSPGNAAPLSATICPGGDTAFRATATGEAALMAYQWQIRPVSVATWTDIADNAVYSGTTTNTLRLNDFTPFSGNSYFVRLVASYPSLQCATSTNQSVLSVRTLASVSLQPTDVTACANTDTAFKVTATGSALLTYQWETDNGSNGATWTPIPGGTLARLPLTNVTMAMNGYKYRVIIGNPCSPPATSDAKTLTVRRSGTWLGARDTKWEEPLNWCGGVPDNTIDVLVPNWPTNMPNISDATNTAFFKSLTIESTARLTISGGTVNNMTGPFDILGTVAYTAPRDQNVFPANHGSLEINGTGNKRLGASVDVSSNLVLGGTAKLVTSANILTMKTGSTPFAASTFTDAMTSWVVTGNGNAGSGNTGLGGLRIEQLDASDGAVTFPIGPTPAAYNPIQLTNAGTVDNFTIAVNDQLIPGGIYAAGVLRTWQVSEATLNGSNVTLALRWQGGEEQSMFTRAETQIIRSNGVQLVQQSVAAPANGSNPYFRAGSNYSTLTQFSVASILAVLPVQLKSFTVRKSGDASVALTWNTDAQFTSKYFSVQRSTDGVRFSNIGQVIGEAGKTSYNYTDNTPGSGTLFYRLQITPVQGDMVYSSIQSLQFIRASLGQLRPSVTAAATTTVYLNIAQQSAVSVYLTDITGRVHWQQTVKLNKGEHQLPVFIGGLTKGVYYVHINDGKGNAEVLTLVKQ